MNTRTNILIILALVVLLAAGALWYSGKCASAPAPAAGRTLVSTVTYSCDKGRTITAAYYQSPAAPAPAPGEPPTPTGSVDVSIGGAATTTLKQTISADGIRYSDGDPQIPAGQPGAETLVFWSKGETALVMRGNSMDLDYTHCVASSSPASQ